MTSRVLLCLVSIFQVSATTDPSPIDHYKVLGVPAAAKPSEVKRAYYQLAKQLHPDRVDASERDAASARFKQVARAYAVLSDQEARKAHDAELQQAHAMRSLARKQQEQATQRQQQQGQQGQQQQQRPRRQQQQRQQQQHSPTNALCSKWLCCIETRRKVA
mmetsp:Transcript_21251/g.46312  ORF Transcript_21251/g.46312 Transcript_21251/m.46312 type:complete len:161 (+) Transcript_21251:70-552(+)